MTAKHPGVVLLARKAATGSVEVAVLAHEPVLRRLDERVGERYMHFPCAGIGFEPALEQDAAT